MDSASLAANGPTHMNDLVPEMVVDKLLLTVVQRQDAEADMRALNEAGLALTVVASTGGFLGAGNVTLLIGLAAADVEKAMAVLKTRNQHRVVNAPRVADVGAATVFVLPVERFVRVSEAAPAVESLREPDRPDATKLIITVVSQRASDRLLKTITDWSYRGTLVSTTGGFSHRRNATVLIGARTDRVDSIVDQIRQVCAQGQQGDSAATVFVLDCARYERI